MRPRPSHPSMVSRFQFQQSIPFHRSTAVLIAQRGSESLLGNLSHSLPDSSGPRSLRTPARLAVCSLDAAHLLRTASAGNRSRALATARSADRFVLRDWSASPGRCRCRQNPSQAAGLTTMRSQIPRPTPLRPPAGESFHDAHPSYSGKGNSRAAFAEPSYIDYHSIFKRISGPVGCAARVPACWRKPDKACRRLSF